MLKIEILEGYMCDKGLEGEMHLQKHRDQGAPHEILKSFCQSGI